MCGMVLGLSPAFSGTLEFSSPQRLATLPWSSGPNCGVRADGAAWLVVDNRGRFWLESNQDFDLFAPNGRYLQTLTPLDKSRNFYGYASMETLPDGRILLLERMESRLEQLGKDNFELRSKPGARLIVLESDGKVVLNKEEVDPVQPHSDYCLEKGGVYGIHEDGSFLLLESLAPAAKDRAFGKFAAVAFNKARWTAHVKSLPVFRSLGRISHDIKGKSYVEKEAVSFLMGHPFVEGAASLAQRDGKIYYQVVCLDNGEFTDSVFVEDSIRKNYALIVLMPTDKDRDAAHGPALFVDRKGNLFEGVAKRDGYRIYEWKAPP